MQSLSALGNWKSVIEAPFQFQLTVQQVIDLLSQTNGVSMLIQNLYQTVTGEKQIVTLSYRNILIHPAIRQIKL